MVKKRKQDQIVACTTSQEPQTDHILNKESKDDQSQPNAELSTRTDAPPNDNAPSQSHQFAATYPWPHMAQYGAEQSPLISGPFVATQPPGVMNQWSQFPQLHQNHSNYLVQPDQPLRSRSYPAAPFWQPQQSGYPLPASNASSNFRPFVAVGATDSSWQNAAAVDSGTSATNQPLIPNFYYHVGYPYLGFPGPCDPSSWSSQAQTHPLCPYSFLGGYIFSPPTSLLSCSATPGQAIQKGTIRPPAKLSQKHQQLWNAQSAENVQLWSAIYHLQSEVTEYKNRITKLEAALSSLKPAAEEATAQVSAAVLSTKPPKRGRPKKSAPSVDAVHSPDKYHRRACARKPAASKSDQFDCKSHLFEKVILNKVVDKEKSCQLTAAVEQGNSASNGVTHSGGNVEINGVNSTMPAFNYEFQHELPGVQTCGNWSPTSSEMKGTDVNDSNCRSTYPIFPQNIPWPYASEAERNELNLGSQGLDNGGIEITQGGQIILGWSFVNEEDASEKLDDTVVGSGKNDNEETMEDESNSGKDSCSNKQ